MRRYPYEREDHTEEEWWITGHTMNNACAMSCYIMLCIQGCFRYAPSMLHNPTLKCLNCTNNIIHVLHNTPSAHQLTSSLVRARPRLVSVV